MKPIHTEGLALFHPPHSGSDTSRDAATAKRSTAASDRERVYAAIVVAPRATCEEICDALGLDGNTVRPRLWELEGNNKFPRRIQKTTATYPTRSGGKAHGYVTVEHAQRQEAA